MERLGKPIDPTKMPMSMDMFPYEVQMAFTLHELLPDVWDGPGGNYFGKNYSALGTLFEVYEIENRKDVMVFLKFIDSYHSKKITEELASKRKSKGANLAVPKAKHRDG